MKKSIIFLVLAASLGSCTTYAQDTLWMKLAPLGNYYYNNWIDTTERHSSCIGKYGLDINAQQFFTGDTLQVYGVAAMLQTFDTTVFCSPYQTIDLDSHLRASYPEDPTFDHCEESLLLFQYNKNDTLPFRQLGDSLPVHMLHTPVSHWVISNTNILNYQDTLPKPIYERYFSAPQVVYDTFYVGHTLTDWAFSKTDDCEPYYVRPPFWSTLICYPDMRRLGTVVAFTFQPRCDVPKEWQIRRNEEFFMFIFPILTPAPDTTVNPSDTTVNPGDSLAIRHNDLIYRYTSVAPNPARNSVRITSSFGISRIEAYDLRGRRIYESPQLSTFSFPLSTIDWPRGTYLLRIATPAGPTTKKLLIQ